MGCGLTLSLTPGPAPVHAAHAGAVRLRHRGPDGNGMVERDLGWTRVAVGMSRLAIVDTRSIPVPFTYPYLGVVLAYNGELYATGSLRAELSDGTPWETDCDAEVVARAWRRWGPAMLDRFNGMFALAVVDERKREVFIARDRAGEKPLYYARHPSGAVHFASEIKALPVRLVERDPWPPDARALEFDCLHDTLFDGVRSVPPGSYEWHYGNRHGTPQVRFGQWWTLPEPDPGGGSETAGAYSDAVDECEALVADAIRIRVAAEVPVALSLSGGLDSAIIQAVAKLDRLYTVTFPEDDFLTPAQAASQGFPVKPVTFTRADLDAALPSVAYHLDTPATWTALCQWFLMQRVREDGAKVIVSGEGADELFGGYSRYRILWHLDRARTDPLLVAYQPTLHRLTGDDVDVLARLINRGGPDTLDAARGLVRRFGLGRSLAEDAARVEWHTTMQCLFRMADRMSAAWSLENRSPFVDHRLIEFAARLPVSFKIDAGASKRILRDVARRLGVADSIVDERTKRGFYVPPSWFGQAGESRWDRSAFAAQMTAAWRGAFAGRVAA